MNPAAARDLHAELASIADEAQVLRLAAERARIIFGADEVGLADGDRTTGVRVEADGRSALVPLSGCGVIWLRFARPVESRTTLAEMLELFQAIVDGSTQLRAAREESTHRQLLERRLAGAFTHVSTYEEFAQELESIATETFDAEYSALYFLDPMTGRVRLAAATGLDAAERVEAERTAGDRHPGRVLRTGEIIEVDDTDSDDANRTVTEAGRRVPIRARVYIPVRSADRIIGAIGMASPRPRAFGRIHRETLEFLGNLAGIAYARLQAEQANARRSRLVEASALAGERLLASTDWRGAVHAALGILGSALDSSTLALVEIVEFTDDSHEEYAWQPIFGAPWMRGTSLARPSASQRTTLARGDALNLPAGPGVPPTVLKPIVVANELWGVLAHEPDESRGGEVDRDERIALRSFSQSVANAISRERLDDDLRRRQRMEAVGSLAAGIAHDFNNLLWPIILYSEMLERSIDSDPHAISMLRDMQQAARRASELVQQVLWISRHRDRSLELVALPDIVANAAHLLARSAPPGVSVRTEIDADAGRVLGDLGELEQVVVTLGTRAVEAVARAGGSVVMRLERSERFDGRWIRLVFEDSASLPDAGACATFFDADAAVEPAGPSRARLQFVRRIVAEHAGRVSAQGGPGEPTTVEVLLPIDASQHEPAVAPDAEAPASLASDDARPGERVLLVDDDAAVLEVARQMLEALGYEVVARSGGQLALTELRDEAQRFDLLLTDFTMPGMTGLELTQEAKALRPKLPVVCCTGFGDERTERRAYEAGMAAFVRKPIEFDALAATIRRAIDGARGA